MSQLIRVAEGLIRRITDDQTALSKIQYPTACRILRLFQHYTVQ